MRHKGYLGRVEFDDEAGLFHGEVVNTRDVITFQGKSVAELRAAFKASIDDYLAFCAQRGEAPDEPYSGRFVTRLAPELHRRLTLAAKMAGKSLNAWVADQLRVAVANADVRDSRGGGPTSVTESRTTRRRVARSRKRR